MELTTLLFLGFFAAVALLNYTLPRVLRPYCLLAASYLFYCWGANDRLLVPVLVAATLVTWGCGLVIGKCRIGPVRVIFLLLAVFTCVGLLFYYKYWNLLAADILSGTVLQPRTDMVTPLGLGYFTLAALSYTIDVYKRRCKVELNPLHYALFVSFFPTMTTGPIERYPHFRPQIHKSRRFSYTRCAGGAFRMLWGYTKKMVLADNMNLYIKMVYDTPAEMNGPNLVAATLLFSLRLYLDFSGCCDIAIGAARILGYDLLENFHSPFEATSFAGLWQRWHMSLTGWLRDYIYIPLGGSRCNVVRHMLNTLIVFAVSGLWHGADLRYLEWGIACGVISVIAQLSKAPRKVLWRYNPLYREPAVQTFLQRCITYLLFSFTMVFFASAIYNAAPGEVFAGILQGWQGGFAAGWESVTNLVTSSGIDGRLPVVLTCGTAIVLAMEHNGQQCCPLDPQAVLCAALDGLLCRCGIHLVLCRVRAVGVHLPAILTWEGDQLCQHRPLLPPRAAPKRSAAVLLPPRPASPPQSKKNPLPHRADAPKSQISSFAFCMVWSAGYTLAAKRCSSLPCSFPFWFSWSGSAIR